MADLLAPGVWWLHETRGSNVFLVEAGDALALIDTGFASSADGIIEELARIAPGRSLTHLLLTHAHPDHTGAAEALRSHFGAQLLAGRGDCTIEAGRAVLSPLANRGPRAPRWLAPLARLRRTARGRGARSERVAPEVLTVDRPLEGELEVASGLLAVPVPGHTPGSYCFVLPERGIAFVGDLVISHRDGLARALARANVDDAAYLEVLRRFADRAPEMGCAGHGPPVLTGFRHQLQELAAQPRRSLWSPRLAMKRVRRMRDFARSISRVRRAPSTKTR